MKIFENIKNGILPEKDTIIELLNNSYKDEENSEEIKNYINILENAYTNSSSVKEKVLLNEVIFVLNLISNSKKEAIYNYLDKILILNRHEISEEDDDFFKKLLEIFGLNSVMEYINEKLLTLDKLKKEESRSFLNWILQVIWNTPLFMNNPKFLELYDNLKSLLYRLIEQNRTDEVMFLEFFIYHIMGNNYQKQEQWKKFNEEINKPCANFYKKYSEENNLIKPNPSKKEKIRIAFIRDRIVLNSPFMVEYSLLKALQENKEFTDKYEIAVYSMNYFEKSFDDEKMIKQLENIGIPVISPAKNFINYGFYNNHLEKALKIRETLIRDDIDIMIGLVGGYDIMGFLFATRCAPTQIYWSHGNCSYDVPGIDKRISHFEQECKEFEWNIFNVPMAEDFLIGTLEERKKGLSVKESLLNTFGKNTIILGTIGRLVKIDSDEYLKTIAEILKQNKNTIYLACGAGNRDSIEEKLDKYNIDKKRFIFAGHVNPHIFGWVIDVWLNSFPLRAGVSAGEFSSKGSGIFITHGQYHQMETIKAFKEIKKEDKYYPVAFSDDEYIKLANYFIRNEKQRKKYAEKISKNYNAKMNVLEFISAILNYFNK